MAKTRPIEYCECGCKGWVYTGKCKGFEHIWIYDSLKEGDPKRVYVYSGHGHTMGTLIDRYPSLDKALAYLATLATSKKAQMDIPGTVAVKCKHLAQCKGPHGTMHHVIFDPTPATVKAIKAWHESEEDAVIHVEDRSGSYVCKVASKAMSFTYDHGTIIVTTNR